MIKSINRRSAWSNYRKNIYTLWALSISSKSSEKETFIAQAGTPGRPGTRGRPQGFSIPQSRTREPPNSTRKKHGGTAEGTWHVWRTIGTTLPDKAAPQLVVMYLRVKNAGSDPTIFSARTDFFHKAKFLQPNPKWIPFQTGQQLISRLRSKKKSCQFVDPQDLRNPVVPRAQQTSPPASRARQGLVPDPAASPSSSQEGEMLQVLSKLRTASGSLRKRASRIWSKISTIKVTRLFTAAPTLLSLCLRPGFPSTSFIGYWCRSVQKALLWMLRTSNMQSAFMGTTKNPSPCFILLCPDKFFYAPTLSLAALFIIQSYSNRTSS